MRQGKVGSARRWGQDRWAEERRSFGKKGGGGKEVEVVNHQREKAVIRKYRNGRQLKTVTSPGARSMERVMEERGRPR